MPRVYTQFMYSDIQAAMIAVDFFRSLAEEMGDLDVDMYGGPQKEPESGQIFIGELPDDLKRLLILLRKDQRKLRKIARNSEPQAIENQVVKLRRRIRKLELVFINSLHEAFESKLQDLPWSGGHLRYCVCKGWMLYMGPCDCDGQQVERSSEDLFMSLADILSEVLKRDGLDGESGQSRGATSRSVGS